MTRTTRNTLLWIGAGVSAVLTLLALRGFGPETYRYLRIRRM